MKLSDEISRKGAGPGMIKCVHQAGVRLVLVVFILAVLAKYSRLPSNQEGEWHVRTSSQNGASLGAQSNVIIPTLASGIPLAQDMLQLREMETFHRVKAFSDAFVKEHESTLSKYSWHIPNPFMTWSRQYEYCYVYAAVRQFAQDSRRSMALLDIGSGVTFFDFLLADSVPGSSVLALDYDNSYPEHPPHGSQSRPFLYARCPPRHRLS